MAGAGKRMRRFWDRRAAEDPFYFVDSRLRYGDPDTERFWSAGASDLDALLAILEVEIQADDEVLEIGCGIGRLTRAIADRAGRVKALDVSARMLELARRYNRALDNVEWMEGDGVSLRGVADRSVDACISHVVFQHIPDPQVTLGYVREMGRVLRAQGWAAFQVSNDPRMHLRGSHGGAWSRRRRRLMAALGRAPRGQDHPAWRGSAVELSALRAAAAEGGLHLDRVVGEGTQFCLVRARRSSGRGNG
jgi:SAM-dependent methyltransferase